MADAVAGDQHFPAVLDCAQNAVEQSVLAVFVAFELGITVRAFHD